MPMDSFDAGAIREYVDTFRDTEPAPEFNGEDDCETSADDPYEPLEPSPSPTPTGATDTEGGAEEDGAKDDDGTADKGSGDTSDGPKADDGAKAGDDDGTADKGSGDGKMEKEEDNN